MQPVTHDILGCRIDDVTMDGAVDRIGAFIREGGPHLIVTLGTEMIVLAQRDPAFRAAINESALSVPDTAGVLWAAKTLGFPLQEQIAGVELIDHVAARAVERGWRMYLLGAAEGVAADAARELQRRHPGLQVAGTHHGYFQDDAAVVEAIKAAAPQVLLIAMGFPRQELWYRAWGEALGVPVGIGVGGSFDVLSGRMQRAPRWIINCRLEWLYRFFRQPRERLARMAALPKFMGMVWAQKMKRGSSK